jgi:hypothetical protein
MDYNTTARSRKTLEFFQKTLLLDLISLFKDRFPAEESENFFRNVLLPLRKLKMSRDEELEQVHGLPEDGKNNLFLISCAYWIESDHALRNGDRELAWSFCLDATSYCAAARSEPKIASEDPIHKVDVLGQARTELGRQAAKARDVPRAKVRSKAIQLIEERGKAGEKWPSRWKMALAIKPEIMSYAARLGVGMSADRAQATIAEYLKAADHLSKFIKKKPTTLAGRR